MASKKTKKRKPARPLEKHAVTGSFDSSGNRVTVASDADLGACVCGAKISYANEVGGRGRRAILHAWPSCSDFERLDPLQFLQFIRRSRGIEAPWDNEN